jgi:hypothetical protein
MNYLVITSVAQSLNELMRNTFRLASINRCKVILVADKKSGNLESSDVLFLDLDKQVDLDLEVLKLLPWNSYSRKNIGYLEALRGGAEWIIETDDDNLPSIEFFNLDLSSYIEVLVASGLGWINIYKYFGNDVVWPRGFPLKRINEQKKLDLPLKKVPISSIGVFQAIADEDPDVDAIFRLTQKLPQQFTNNIPVLLEYGTVCPFNSQATWWNSKYAVLMYFPSEISWRVADIWRSYIAIRILQANSISVVFTGPLVKQLRNNHDLLVDFKQEIDCYLGAEDIWNHLLNLDSSLLDGKLSDALLTVYHYLVELGIMKSQEIRILNAWINDFERITTMKSDV